MRSGDEDGSEGGRESTRRTPLPAYIHLSFSAAVYLIEGGKRRRYLSLCVKRSTDFFVHHPAETSAYCYEIPGLKSTRDKISET